MFVLTKRVSCINVKPSNFFGGCYRKSDQFMRTCGNHNNSRTLYSVRVIGWEWLSASICWTTENVSVQLRCRALKKVNVKSCFWSFHYRIKCLTNKVRVSGRLRSKRRPSTQLYMKDHYGRTQALRSGRKIYSYNLTCRNKLVLIFKERLSSVSYFSSLQ